MTENQDRQIQDLVQQVARLTRQLDETRRRVGLSPIVDDQVLSINARRTGEDHAA